MSTDPNDDARGWSAPDGEGAEGVGGVGGAGGAGGAGTADALLELVPQMRVVHGAPDDEELVALVAGLVATQRAANAAADREARTAAPERGGWTDRARQLGAPPRPGRGAWRASGR